jgi:hypothetical protein
MKALFDLSCRSLAADYKGGLVLAERKGQFVYGLIGTSPAGNLLCTYFLHSQTRASSVPGRFVPVEQAKLELVLPTETSDWRRDPQVGDLVVDETSVQLLAIRSSTEFANIDMDTGDVGENWPKGMVFSHWRIFHPTAAGEMRLLYDSQAGGMDYDDDE